MKKIIIMCSIVLSGFAFAQENTDNPYVYDDSSSLLAEEDINPGNPGDPLAAPIDQYIPALLIAAFAMVVFFSKKKETAE